LSKAGGHFQRFNSLIGDSDTPGHLPTLGEGVLKTWLVLERFAGPDGLTRVGQETIAKIIGRSRAQVIRNMKRLQTMGLLESVTKATGPGTNATWRVLATERVASAMQPVKDDNALHLEGERVASDAITRCISGPNALHPNATESAMSAMSASQPAEKEPVAGGGVLSPEEADRQAAYVACGVSAALAEKYARDYPDATGAQIRATFKKIGRATNPIGALIARVKSGDLAAVKTPSANVATSFYSMPNRETSERIQDIVAKDIGVRCEHSGAPTVVPGKVNAERPRPEPKPGAMRIGKGGVKERLSADGTWVPGWY